MVIRGETPSYSMVGCRDALYGGAPKRLVEPRSCVKIRPTAAAQRLG